MGKEVTRCNANSMPVLPVVPVITWWTRITHSEGEEHRVVCMLVDLHCLMKPHSGSIFA